MKAPDIKDYDLDFDSLSERFGTDFIVVHHTGNPQDDDLSAKEIHESHKAQGWSGCGYHYIIRKNGQVEQGRPEWAIGSHAYGENWHSLGVHVCGNFELYDDDGEPVKPTDYQIESLAYLLGYLCDKYGLDPYEDIVAHRDLMATACCGQHLYDMLEEIKGKAAWYMENYKGGD